MIIVSLVTVETMTNMYATITFRLRNDYQICFLETLVSESDLGPPSPERITSNTKEYQDFCFTRAQLVNLVMTTVVR